MVVNGREMNNSKRRQQAKNAARWYGRRAIERQYGKTEDRPRGLRAGELDYPRSDKQRMCELPVPA